MGCVICGVNQARSIADFCYLDLMSDELVRPRSPEELKQKHVWILVETTIWDTYFGGDL